MSYEIAQAYVRRYSGKFFAVRAETKRYAGGCRNVGLGFSGIDAEYTYFLDSDDYLASSGTVAEMERSIRSAGNPDAALFAFSFDYGGRVQPCVRSRQRFDQAADDLMSFGWNSSSARAIRSSFEEPYPEGLMRDEDTVQWMKLLDKGPRVAQFGFDAFVYRRHAGSATYSDIFDRNSPLLVEELRKLIAGAKNPHVRASAESRLRAEAELAEKRRNRR